MGFSLLMAYFLCVFNNFFHFQLLQTNTSFSIQDYTYFFRGTLLFFTVTPFLRQHCFQFLSHFCLFLTPKIPNRFFCIFLGFFISAAFWWESFLNDIFRLFLSSFFLKNKLFPIHSARLLFRHFFWWDIQIFGNHYFSGDAIFQWVPFYFRHSIFFLTSKVLSSSPKELYLYLVLLISESCLIFSFLGPIFLGTSFR